MYSSSQHILTSGLQQNWLMLQQAGLLVHCVKYGAFGDTLNNLWHFLHFLFTIFSSSCVTLISKLLITARKELSSMYRRRLPLLGQRQGHFFQKAKPSLLILDVGLYHSLQYIYYISVYSLQTVLHLILHGGKKCATLCIVCSLIAQRGNDQDRQKVDQHMAKTLQSLLLSLHQLSLLVAAKTARQMCTSVFDASMCHWAFYSFNNLTQICINGA